jgi:hypothetical protein
MLPPPLLFFLEICGDSLDGKQMEKEEDVSIGEEEEAKTWIRGGNGKK